ncbi:MAG: cytochrome P450 [Actinomycetota bacterium]|nr:cytochrome P450 [Actinomycetota bacterium]
MSTSEDVLAAAHELFELDEERVRCPYPVFSGLHAQSPVIWFDEIESFVVTDYDIIVDVLKQPDRFSSRFATGRATEVKMMGALMELAMEDPEVLAMAQERMQEGLSPVLLSADPPAHPRQRALVNRAFTPGVIRTMEPEIERLCDQLLQGFQARGSVELVKEYAGPLPMIVIANAMGVPLEDLDEFSAWSNTVVSAIGNSTITKEELGEIFRARNLMSDYLLSIVKARIAEPRDDLISKITEAEIDGQRLTPAEVSDMAIQFMLAGNETTAKLIAAATLHLAQDPDLADRLRKDPDAIVPFVEEQLRFEPPINGTYRIADVECELGGVHIPADSSLWLVYAAGNRSEKHFEEPDECQWAREQKSQHLAFGLGPHYCLGATLARAEARIAIRMLLERCGDIALDIPVDQVPYDTSFMLHGLKQLPLTFTPTS